MWLSLSVYPQNITKQDSIKSNSVNADTGGEGGRGGGTYKVFVLSGLNLQKVYELFFPRDKQTVCNNEMSRVKRVFVNRDLTVYLHKQADQN